MAWPGKVTLTDKAIYFEVTNLLRAIKSMNIISVKYFYIGLLS